MPETPETQILGVDERLRLVLFGLECALNVELDPSVVETVFSDAAYNLTNVRYTLWTGAGVQVTGYVEDYEPGTLWLTVRSRRRYEPALALVVERASHQMLRWIKWREAPEQH